MAICEIIITDVTCYGTLYCVAGWNPQTRTMVRPEPPTANADYEPSRFWSADWAGPGKFFAVGNVVRFDAGGPPAGSPFPHANEDRIWIQGELAAVVAQLAPAEVAVAVGGSVSPTISAAFGGALIRAPSTKAYVPAGHNGPSLGAVEFGPNQIILYEDAYVAAKPKLRARLVEEGVAYDLSVPADAARTRWKTAGIDALRGDLQASQRVHVRLGLSRPFSAMPNECYSQVNGLYFL